MWDAIYTFLRNFDAHTCGLDIHESFSEYYVFSVHFVYIWFYPTNVWLLELWPKKHTYTIRLPPLLAEKHFWATRPPEKVRKARAVLCLSFWTLPLCGCGPRNRLPLCSLPTVWSYDTSSYVTEVEVMAGSGPWFRTCCLCFRRCRLFRLWSLVLYLLPVLFGRLWCSELLNI